MSISSEILYAVVVLSVLLIFHFYYRKREAEKERDGIAKDNNSLHTIIDNFTYNCRGLDRLLNDYYRELERLTLKCLLLARENEGVAQLQEEISDLQKKHHVVLTENHKNIMLAQENAKVAVDVFNVLQRMKQIAPDVVSVAEDQVKKEQKMRRAIKKQDSKGLKLVKKDSDDK